MEQIDVVSKSTPEWFNTTVIPYYIRQYITDLYIEWGAGSNRAFVW